MTTPWLILSLSLAPVALFAIWSRRESGWRTRSVLVLPACSILAWVALQTVLGMPAHGLPAGEHTVLGSRIDTPTAESAGAIYVLLDGLEPRYYKLPYSQEAADALQGALDGGNGVAVEVGDGGEADFHEPPVTEDQPKQPERPAITIGG